MVDDRLSDDDDEVDEGRCDFAAWAEEFRGAAQGMTIRFFAIIFGASGCLMSRCCF